MGSSSPNVVFGSKFGPIIVNVKDKYIGHVFLKGGYWAADEIELLAAIARRRAGPDRNILFYDVGANIGTHSLAMARTFGEQIRIRAFEAQSYIFNMLCGTMALNDITRVECHRAAVSDTPDDEISIDLPDYHAFNNFGGLELRPAERSDNREMVRSGRRERVRTTTIDSFDESLDLLKIDVEGMELAVLEGAGRSICASRPACMVELAKSDPRGILAFFAARDYVAYAFRANAVFLPREDGIVLDGLGTLE